MMLQHAGINHIVGFDVCLVTLLTNYLFFIFVHVHKLRLCTFIKCIVYSVLHIYLLVKVKVKA